MSYRIIVVDESNEDEHVLMLNEEVEEEVAEGVVEMVEDGCVETFEGCADVCSVVSEMLEEAGVGCEDHEEMVKELGKMKLVVVGKEGNGGNGGSGKKKRVVKKNGNGGK